MVARAIWKAELKLNGARVPVRLYSAVRDRTVRFHILERGSKTRVKQHMVNAENGDEVPTGDVRKGFAVGPDTFVIFEPEELEALEPKESRAIEIKRFMPLKAIAPEFYDRPYYLGPDGDAKSYFSLAAALRNQKREGLAHWVMRKQRFVGALRAEGDYLVLCTLRPADEVVPARVLPQATGPAPDKKELAMARQLVGLLKGEFDAEEYRNEYRERVTEFVERKAKGHAPRLRLVKSKHKTTALAQALSKSLAA